MTMKLCFLYATFFLCFSTITADLGESNEPVCTPDSYVTEHLIETDKSTRAAVHLIKDKLLLKMKSYYASPEVYKFQLDVPVMNFCDQLFYGGSLTFYYWRKENYKIDCVFEDACDTLHGELLNTVNCTASYRIFTEDGATDFDGPTCE